VERRNNVDVTAPDCFERTTLMLSVFEFSFFVPRKRLRQVGCDGFAEFSTAIQGENSQTLQLISSPLPQPINLPGNRFLPSLQGIYDLGVYSSPCLPAAIDSTNAGFF